MAGVAQACRHVRFYNFQRNGNIPLTYWCYSRCHQRCSLDRNRMQMTSFFLLRPWCNAIRLRITHAHVVTSLLFTCHPNFIRKGNDIYPYNHVVNIPLFTRDLSFASKQQLQTDSWIRALSKWSGTDRVNSSEHSTRICSPRYYMLSFFNYEVSEFVSEIWHDYYWSLNMLSKLI